ncbi:MAG: hypothetical protein ACYDH2_09110 [Anaerolineaceae bacterium]
MREKQKWNNKICCSCRKTPTPVTPTPKTPTFAPPPPSSTSTPIQTSTPITVSTIIDTLIPSHFGVREEVFGCALVICGGVGVNLVHNFNDKKTVASFDILGSGGPGISQLKLGGVRLRRFACRMGFLQDRRFNLRNVSTG